MNPTEPGVLSRAARRWTVTLVILFVAALVAFFVLRHHVMPWWFMRHPGGLGSA